MKDKITAEDMIESLGLEKKPKLFLYRVIHWFVVLLGLAFIQYGFRVLSRYVEWNEALLLFGGWVTCVIYYTIKDRI